MAEQQISSQHRVWQTVKAIPKGKVATYGQIAALAAMPAHARLVGRILAQLPADSRLPWHRVLGSGGKITNPNRQQQADRLADEGVLVQAGRVSLKRYQWLP